MKIKTEIQHNDHNIDMKEIEVLVKENVKALGVKMTTIESLQIYYTPDSSSVYYVATTKDGKVYLNNEPLYI